MLWSGRRSSVVSGDECGRGYTTYVCYSSRFLGNKNRLKIPRSAILITNAPVETICVISSFRCEA